MKIIKENKIVRYLLETHSDCDLNRLWKMYNMGFFKLEELKEFYYLIGSSDDLMEGIEAFNPPPIGGNPK